MDRFINALKAHAGAMDLTQGQPRFGIVSSFDPNAYTARVSLQPEGVLTGWLPVLSPWIGAGWGLACPPSPGDQVMVLPHEGDADNGVVVGSAYSQQALPPQTPSGELWLVHKSGSFLKLHNDGSIESSAPTWKHAGNLVVSGDISDQNGAKGSLNTLRQDYDQHTHDVNGNVSSTPTPQD